MRGRAAVLIALVLAVLLATAAPALAGAPNFVCEFGALRIAADVHFETGLLQEAPGRPLKRVDVPTYVPGGAGFIALRKQQRYSVRLRNAPPTHQRVRSDLVWTIGGGSRTLAGVCSVIRGDQHPGTVTTGATIRTKPDRHAPRVADASALPIVWSVPTINTPAFPSGWIAVQLWRADGGHSDGFVPRAQVSFAAQ
jgi:hypothetical protein